MSDPTPDSAELVAAVQALTGLSEPAVRSVLWQTRRVGWSIVRLATYSGVEPPYVAEEWTP